MLSVFVNIALLLYYIFINAFPSISYCIDCDYIVLILPPSIHHSFMKLRHNICIFYLPLHLACAILQEEVVINSLAL